MPLVLGGDHSVALGTLGGLAAAHGLGGVLWIDAHGDLNTPETSPTGNVHGMPLAAALGLADEPLRERAAGRCRRSIPHRVALVGLRVGRRARARADPRARDRGLHDERHRPGRDRARDPRVARPHRRARLRARLARHGRARSGGRAGRRHAGARRPLLPRGAPRARARRRVGPRRLARGRRGEPDPRSRERDGASSRSSSSRARSARRSSRSRGSRARRPAGRSRHRRRNGSKRCAGGLVHLGARRPRRARRASARSDWLRGTSRRGGSPPSSAKRYSTATSSTVDVREPGLARELLDPLRLAERELAGLARPRRLQQPALDQHRAVAGRPGVPLRAGPGREREPSPRAGGRAASRAAPAPDRATSM